MTIDLSTLHDDAVLLEPEAREILRVSKVTLIRMRHQGRVSFVRLSERRIGFRYGDLKRYLAGRTTTDFRETA